MFTKNIPESTRSLTGPGIERRGSHKTTFNTTINECSLPHYSPTCQYHFGNKCAHDRLNQRIFVQPSHHKRRIPLIENAKQRITEAYSDTLKYEIAPLFFHKDKLKKDGSYRKLRSEAKEMATGLFGAALLHALNLGKMSLGYFNEQLNRFIYFDFDYLARITITGAKRVQRAAQLFIKAGYMEVIQRKKRLASGEIRSLSPIIKIKKKLLLDLGIAPEQVTWHCDRAKKDIEKKENKIARQNNIEIAAQEPIKARTAHEKEVAQRSIKDIIKNLASKFNNTS